MAAPDITTQPTSQNVLIGSTVSFSVVATGASSYQWFTGFPRHRHESRFGLWRADRHSQLSRARHRRRLRRILLRCHQFGRHHQQRPRLFPELPRRSAPHHGPSPPTKTSPSGARRFSTSPPTAATVASPSGNGPTGAAWPLPTAAGAQTNVLTLTNVQPGTSPPQVICKVSNGTGAATVSRTALLSIYGGQHRDRRRRGRHAFHAAAHRDGARRSRRAAHAARRPGRDVRRRLDRARAVRRALGELPFSGRGRLPDKDRGAARRRRLALPPGATGGHALQLPGPSRS